MENEKARRERGEGRIFKRGNVCWVQYYVRGRQVRESAGTNEEKKAGRFLRRKLGEVAAGIHRDWHRVTYEQLRESFYGDYRTNGRKSLRHDPEGNPVLDKVKRLDGFFSGFLASEIDADLVRKFHADQQVKGLSNGSINRSVSALRRMFNLGKHEGRIREVPYFPMLKEAAPREGFFEREQYETLFAALPDYLRLPLALGYYTGMREGEILGLEWNQIDFRSGVIRLRAGETKNDEGREVPIVPQLRGLLKEQYAKRESGCEYVCFRFDQGGHAAKIEGFRKAWYSACIRVGLGRMEPEIDALTGETVLAKPRVDREHPKPKVKMVYRGMIFHDLRRTRVRNLVRAGVPERVAMAISGHKTRSVFERYNIVSPSDVREAGRKLGEYHSQNSGDNSGTACTTMQQVDSVIN